MIYPLATLGPTIDSTGITAPAYSDIVLSLQASYKLIYGSNIYISSDSQDGQWIAIQAKAINDTNQAAIAVFQSFSPTYAQGAGLSSLVKINGINRNISSYSTAIGNVVGVAGTVILSGVVVDASGNKWSLPATVTIPIGGSISAPITCQTAGAIIALSGSITSIFNPQYGWQTFTSTADAVAGAPVELDPALRSRQSISSATPSQSILSGIRAAVANVINVFESAVYENDTSTTDANGIPAHSISVVTFGGSSADIAAAIAKKKPPGVQTYGTTSAIVYDSAGVPDTINYFAVSIIGIYFAITIKALPNYVSTTEALIQQAITSFIDGAIAGAGPYQTRLGLGISVYASQLEAAASLIGQPEGQTFYITSFTLGTAPAPTGTSNIAIAFNAMAVTDNTRIVITVT